MIVVGAGVVGASIAYYLGRAGARVTLLDRDAPGARTSRVSFGYINAIWKRPEDYHRLSRLGVERYASLSEELGPDAGLGHGGGMHWPASWPEGLDGLDTRVQELDELGYPFQVLSSDEASRLEPNVRLDGPVLYVPSESWADADLLARSLVRLAEEHGVSLRTDCSVREVITIDGRAIGVSTSEGLLRAGLVVVAAGVASAGLVAPLGFSLPLERVVGVLALTSPVPGVVNRVLYPGDYHVRPAADGRVAIGCRMMDSLADEDTDTSVPPSWADEMLRMAQRDIAGLGGATVQELRVGARPMPGDGLPVVGAVPSVRNAYVAVMHSGVTLAAIVGDTVAEEIVSGRLSPMLAPYRPERFSGPGHMAETS